MARLIVEEEIAAPVGRVFALASDFAHVADIIPAITKIEILTPGPIGVGTRFRETRLVFNKEHTEEMEFTHFDPPHSYTLQAVSCGALYITTFRFSPTANGTHVEVDFQSRPQSFLAWLMTPLGWLMAGMLKKCLREDLLGLKKASEMQVAAS